MGLGPRSQQVYRTLCDEIEQGILTPGSMLPPERLLGQRFAVGRSTIRRALGKLAAEGLIVTRAGAGSQVAEQEARRRMDVIACMYDGPLSVLTAIQDKALKSGCLLALFSQVRQAWNPLAEAAFLQQVKAQRHRGLLAFCSPVEPRNEEALAELAADGVRVIHIDHYRPEVPAEGYLLPDYRLAGSMAVRLLRSSGYAHCIFVAMTSDGPFAKLVEGGFLEELGNERRRPFTFQNRRPNYFEMPRVGRDEDAETAIGLFLTGFAEPVGFLCSTCDRATILLGICRRLALAVPEQVGIIAVETMGAMGSTPPVDCLHFAREQMLDEAMQAALHEDLPLPRKLVAPSYRHCGTVKR